MSLQNNENTQRNVNMQDGSKSEKAPCKLFDRRWKKILVSVLAVLVGVALIAAGCFSVLWFKGKQSLKTEAPNMTASNLDAELDDDVVIYKGDRYKFNPDITSLLFIGTDGKSKELNGKKSGYGQADALFLAAINTKIGEVSLISIPRDSMARVRVYSDEGNFIDTEQMQICLSYAYGQGGKLSCENTVEAVSNLMYGININTYFCLDWKAVSEINDMVGGVTVDEYDAKFNKTGKKVTLKGQAALDYILLRDHANVNSSINRLDRQISYIKSFSSQIIEKTKQDISTPLSIYNKINSRSINTLDASKITYLSTVFLNGGAKLNFESITGEMVQGEKYAEFYPDEQALYELVLKVYYQKLK